MNNLIFSSSNVFKISDFSVQCNDGSFVLPNVERILKPSQKASFEKLIFIIIKLLEKESQLTLNRFNFCHKDNHSTSDKLIGQDIPFSFIDFYAEDLMLAALKTKNEIKTFKLFIDYGTILIAEIYQQAMKKIGFGHIKYDFYAHDIFPEPSLTFEFLDNYFNVDENTSNLFDVFENACANIIKSWIEKEDYILE